MERLRKEDLTKEDLAVSSKMPRSPETRNNNHSYSSRNNEKLKMSSPRNP